MDRRDFVKLCSLTGLSVVAGGAAIGGGKAEAFEDYDGPLFMHVHAGGGWDPTSLCDPKGDAPSLMNNYPVSAIQQAGNIRYAPMWLTGNTGNTDENTEVQLAFETFFNTYAPLLTVINGIDTATNSHDAGTRNTWSGSLTEGAASVAALIAAVNAPTSPMGFITNGGYDVTGGSVAAVRTGNIDALFRIAFPNRVDAFNNESRLFHSEITTQRMAEARVQRFQAAIAEQRLPRLRESMSRLYTSRLGNNELAKLTEFLPENIEGGLRGQAQLAIAAYKAGLCCSANLSAGGFDTHGDNDQGQRTSLANVLDGVHFAMQEAERQGVTNNIVIFMGSDFGRTPGYNDGNGKDHWSITSMMAMGSVRGQPIPGNRVIGGTTFEHDPLGVDPNTLQPVEGGGVRITPAHVIRSIRRLAGVAGTEIDQLFPIGVDQDLNIFA